MAGQKAVSQYKICIVTEAAGLAGRWAGRVGGVRGVRGVSGARRMGARGAGRRHVACAHLGVLLG